MSLVNLMDEVKRINAEVEARTGYRAYQYTSAPTPTSNRIVFGDEVVFKPEDALAKIQKIQAKVDGGTWDHWNCRRECAWSFNTEAERDKHEAEHKHQ